MKSRMTMMAAITLIVTTSENQADGGAQHR
jgi:hypothetical protein